MGPFVPIQKIQKSSQYGRIACVPGLAAKMAGFFLLEDRMTLTTYSISYLPSAVPRFRCPFCFARMEADVMRYNVAQSDLCICK